VLTAGVMRLGAGVTEAGAGVMELVASVVGFVAGGLEGAGGVEAGTGVMELGAGVMELGASGVDAVCCPVGTSIRIRPSKPGVSSGGQARALHWSLATRNNRQCFCFAPVFATY
jgi:hypothetical protein